MKVKAKQNFLYLLISRITNTKIHELQDNQLIASSLNQLEVVK